MHSHSKKVFFIPWNQKDRLSELLKKSGAEDFIEPKDLVAIKMHFGEKGNDGYIKAEFVRPAIKLIQQKKAAAFLTDTGTIYNGNRSNAPDHLQLAAEHGFSQTRLQTPVVIADGLIGNDYYEVEVGGKYFKKVKIASAIYEADCMLVLSHFKGHLLTGFGGALKNLGMGCAARLGKFEMHSSVSPTVESARCTACGACIERCAHKALSFEDGKIHLNKKICAGCGECVIVCNFGALSITWNEGQARVQEKIAEYARGAILNKRCFFINFLNHITPNCDCLSKKETPLLPDIGIMASEDPVAIDQASLDLVIKQGGDVFKKTYPHIDYNIQLECAEKLGVGSRNYALVVL